MSSEKEDIHLPGDQTLMTTAPVTTVPTPVTTVPTMTLASLGYCPLNLGVVGSYISRTHRKTRGGYQWSMIDSSTQESWSLTPKPIWESWYKYEQLHKMGTCLQRVESAGRLIQAVEETVMGIPAIVMQVVQAELRLQQPWDQLARPPPWLPQDQQVPIPGLDLGPGEPTPVLRPPEIIPKRLVDAKFNGTPEKLACIILAFFEVQVEKFLQAWGHLFPSKERMVDYITAQLQGRAADWYVSLHQVRGPEL
ncbi:UNVERIFIED_CONTAM: hypothetical protein K2H54_052836 [Gekko kuhli]